MSNINPLIPILAVFNLALIVYLILKSKQVQKLILIKSSENEQLKKLITSKDVTLSNISHEIKNPISAIIGIHEKILANKTLPTYEHRILESAKESAQSMLEMLNQVLDASKIAAGKVQLEETASDLKNLLKNIDRTLSIAATKSEVKLTTHICPEIAPSLVFDGVKLNQVLHNLISNAIKFSNKGHVILTTRVIANDHFAQIIYFEIADDGVGMPSEQINRLLRPYEQINTQHLNIENIGTGLGLGITDHLLKLMHSQISIESEINQGTTASFQLLLTRSTDEPKYGSKTIKESPPLTNVIKSKSVLIVDDHAPSRLITESQFKDMGYCVHSYQNALLGKDFLLNTPFDILVTDFSMPEMDGEKLAQMARNAYADNIQIYGITAHTDGAKKLLDQNSPFDSVLIKPASISDWKRELNLYDTYITSLVQLGQGKSGIYLTIAKEILAFQQQAISLLNSGLLDHQIKLPEREVKAMAHKVLGGANLTRDMYLIKVASQFEKSCPQPNKPLFSEMCIALTKSNKILKKIITEKTFIN
ncbi:MAG: hybrid sensor histidine kinase/response regulator [Polynucleobacter victoriensis]